MVKMVHQWRFNAVLLSFFCLALFSFTDREARPLHPYFVSVVEINHNAADKTLEISCKIFIDDFQKALGKKYNTSVDLINAKDKAAVDKLVSDYIKNHLLLKIDSRAVIFHYLGYEIAEEAAWSYYQVDNVASIKNIEATNSILYDFIDKQINIIHVTVGGERKSTKLDYPKSVASFSF